VKLAENSANIRDFLEKIAISNFAALDRQSDQKLTMRTSR
jgi:hypothetical protein